MATATKKKNAQQIKLQPLGDRLVVQRDVSGDKTEGGIFLPDSAKDKPTRGTVISIGDGRLLDDGSRGPMQVKAGDRVLFTSYAGETIEVGDEEYILMGESEVLAVLE
ncbi:MAG: co-chaperone GroES [Pirellulaceae bacterium]